MGVQLLSLPGHYNPANAYDAAYAGLPAEELLTAATLARRQYGLKAVGSDRVKAHLLVIDNQFDFSFPDGKLFVGGRSGKGAMDDQRRLVEFIYRNAGVLSYITCTMDTHLPFQIFFPSAHVLADGSNPSAHTVITAEEYANGTYHANPVMAAQLGVDPAWLDRQFRFYCQQLEQSGRYALYLWPFHCQIGNNGHRLTGFVDEARMWHSFLRGAENRPQIKGGNPLTEHYSIIQPDVTTTWDGKSIPGAQINTALLKTLLESQVVIIAGQAKSHCVAWTIDDLLTQITKQDPALAQKVYLLEDCTSPVVVPGVRDFTPEADAAFDRFRNAGMHVVSSTDPIESWPGIQL